MTDSSSVHPRSRRRPGALASILALGLVIGALTPALPARAQWAPVVGLPSSEVYSVWASGDTVVAGADTSVYVSMDAGATWRLSRQVTAGANTIQAVWFRSGRLYAGTFGQGVHVSDDLGLTWSPFNQGLVGGFLDSQLSVVDFQVRGDLLVVATAGAGAYARDLATAGTWQHFGDVFEPNQASNLNAVGLGGDRLLALGGGNGMVFHNDPSETDWVESFLDNRNVHAGLQAQSVAWTGTGWVVGSNLGIFSSVAAQEPWTRFDARLGPLTWTALATQKNHLYGAFNTSLMAVIEESTDDGATWTVDEVQPGVFVQKLAVGGNRLFAARGDGLWSLPLNVTSVESGAAPSPLRFALVGSQPSGSQMRLRFELPRPEAASIEVFDVHGRLVADRIEGSWGPGRHEVTLNAQHLASGIYLARLSAGGLRQVVRIVRVR